MKEYSILCVDDEKSVVDVLSTILTKSGYSVFTALRGEDALKLLNEKQFDLAIIDYKMPGMNGIDLLKKINALNIDVAVLLLTGYGTIPNAVESIKLGADDYILKPFHKDDILIRIGKILESKMLHAENLLLKTQLQERFQLKNIIGKTPKMVEIIEMIPKLAASDSTVLILGETGTGKEEFSKAIYFSGNRAKKLFNVVDCSTINPNLFESELFGHVKGAFTGAMRDNTGLLKATENGTLFLDEIAEIPIHIQVKLLRAIEELVIRPVGSDLPLMFGPLFKLVNSSIYSLLYYPLALRPNPVV